jgi:hypothetical protein
MARNYAVALDESFSSPLSGTSASTPVLAHCFMLCTIGWFSSLFGYLQVFAAMVSQVNAKRLAAGKSSLGWINPSLYSLASSILLNDVTSGNNNCVEQNSDDIPDAPYYFCCAQGFSAAPGWDPVTGIGSVNYTAFEIAFFALGNVTSSPSGSSSNKLSAGAIAGIVIGGVAFAAIVGGLAFFLLRRKHVIPNADVQKSIPLSSTV